MGSPSGQGACEARLSGPRALNFWLFGRATLTMIVMSLSGLDARVPVYSSIQAAPAASGSRFATTGCEESLWRHVYRPKRLKVMSRCIGVTGTVEESVADDDGDQHFLLRLDAGQESLINKRNRKKKSGDLVVEIVCANPVRLPKVKSACTGYRNQIALPGVGDHVKVTGTYVIDSNNGWAEIHPVSGLEKVSG